jgi:acyl carrier protein
MTEQQLFDKIIEIIKPYVKNHEALATVSKDTNILDDLKVNSARLVDIVLTFEDEFKIEIADEDADEVDTVGDAIKLIQKKIS